LLFGLREKKEEAALPLTEEEPPSVEDIFDLSKALDVVAGQKELFQEIAHLFLENLPVHLNQIQEGIAKGDARALEHAAHSLKGSVGILAPNGPMTRSIFSRNWERMEKQTRPVRY